MLDLPSEEIFLLGGLIFLLKSGKPYGNRRIKPSNVVIFHLGQAETIEYDDEN